MANGPNELTDIAYYYPNPIWRNGDWIKNLILFFDGVALLVPEYMRERPFRVDPAITAGLEEHGLLHIFEPEKFIDEEATMRLAAALEHTFKSGVLDGLSKKGSQFHELSRSRLGAMADRQLAESMFSELKRRGLAMESEDGASIPMHPLIRVLILVLWAQILRENGRKAGFRFHPSTDSPAVHIALTDLLEAPQMPSAGHVVAMDMETVGIDLGSVPLDEVLDFRKQNGGAYRSYARQLRRFLREVSILTPEKQGAALLDRKEEIRDLTADLQRKGKDWKRDVGFGLGLAGAAWTIAQGDPIGALLVAGGTIIGSGGSSSEASAYSYLFDARRKLA